MPKEFSRTLRIAEQIQREVMAMLVQEAGDPRLHHVTITRVEVSRDLAHARLYVTILGDEAEQAEILAALHRAGAFLRARLAQRLRLRGTPRLHFELDEAVSRGERVSSLLASLGPSSPPDDEDQ